MQIYLTRYHNFNIVGCLNSIVHELYNVDTFLILVYVLSSPVIKCSSFIVLKRVNKISLAQQNLETILLYVVFILCSFSDHLLET
jgi:hypothetical protein